MRWKIRRLVRATEGRPYGDNGENDMQFSCLFLGAKSVYPQNTATPYLKTHHPTRRGDHRLSAVSPTFCFCIFSKKLVSAVQRKAGYANERTNITAKAAIARATPPLRKIFETLPSLAGGRSPSRSLMPLVCLNSTKIPAIDITVKIIS